MEGLLNSTLDSFAQLQLNIPSIIEDEVGAVLDSYQLKTDKLTSFLNSPNGLVSVSGNVISARSISSSSSLLTVTNGDGVAGNPTLTLSSSIATTNTAQTLTNKTIDGLNNIISNVNLSVSAVGILPVLRGGTGASTAGAARTSLDVLQQPSTNGLVSRVATGQSVGRTIIGSGGISVSNGNGVSGNPTLSIAENADLPGSPTTLTQPLEDSSTKIATTQFVRQTIETFSAVRGYIVFNGATGSVIKSSKLSLAKSGTGNYEITTDPTIRDGTSNWGVVIGNVDHGILSQADTQTNAGDTLDIWNTFVTTRSVTGFSLRATRKYNRYRVFVAADGDGNATQMFGITSVDPSYIALVVF